MSFSPAMLLAVAAGGALGSVCRYALLCVMAARLGGGFPFGTLAANALGSFIMGVVVELSALAWSPGAELRAFITVGILGGFTTFSTFSLDTAVLIQRGDLALAAVYVVLSVFFSVGGLFAGLALVRGVV